MKKKPYLYGAWGICWCVFLLLSGCLKNEETDIEKRIKADDEAIRQYLTTSNQTAVPKYYGSYTFYAQELQANPSGTAVQPNDILTIYYKVSTLGGPVFDSLTAVTGNPLKLKLLSSESSLIPVGLDAGLSLMKRGEKYRFYIPSTLAFSDYYYSAAFPSYSNLVVDAEVVDIVTPAQQKAAEDLTIRNYFTQNNISEFDSLGNGLYFVRTHDGAGSLPASGKTVVVKYVGKFLDGTVFDQSGSNNYSIILGNSNVIPGFRDGVARMKKGEKGKLVIPSHLAYGASRQVVPLRIREDLIGKNMLSKIPPYTPITFDLEIIDIK